ncbi:MAG TPA: hypothetical protein VGG68_14350 [Caulobacteraceae bacterium]
MDRYLNLGLMAHPLNWATIVLMCAFALVLLHLVAPETPPPSSSA